MTPKNRDLVEVRTARILGTYRAPWWRNVDFSLAAGRRRAEAADDVRQRWKPYARKSR